MNNSVLYEMSKNMIENNSSLWREVAQKAPWLMEGKEALSPFSIEESALQVIDDINNYHLTIVTGTGRVYRQYLTINIEDSWLQIDKPFKWIDTTSSFHVFFRNRSNIWNFFRVKDAQAEVTTIRAEIPDKIYALARRRHRRIPTPYGTKAIFKNHNGLIDIMNVRNISEGGMLISDNSSVNRYPINALINEIFLTIPPQHMGQEVGTAHRVLPFITSGKIVRASQNQTSSLSCYAVSFQHQNLSLSRRFRQVINDFENLLK